jgi:lysophospholipase L1-like esterase
VALILADTGIAAARGWHFDSRLDRLGFDVALTAFFATVLLWLLPSGRSWLARRGPQLILASMATICGLILAEIASMLLTPLFEPPIHLRRPGTETIYHPQPGVMRGISGVSHTKINSWGLRGDEPPPADKTVRILCLGASSTNCTYLDESETWASVLQKTLNAEDPTHRYWVGNAGIPSLTTQQHLEFLEKLPIPGAVDCVILQAGINDFMQAIAPAARPAPFWVRSHLWRLATSVVRRYLKSPDVVVEDAAGRSYVRRRAQRVAAEKVYQLPDLKQRLAEYTQRLNAIITACQRNKVRLIVTSQPVLWKDSPDADNEPLYWFGRMADDRYLATAELRQGMDLYNRRTREVCKERGVEFVDLSNLNGDAKSFYDDCHYTEEGARQVARRVADYLLLNASASQASAAKSHP